MVKVLHLRNNNFDLRQFKPQLRRQLSAQNFPGFSGLTVYQHHAVFYCTADLPDRHKFVGFGMKNIEGLWLLCDPDDPTRMFDWD